MTTKVSGRDVSSLPGYRDGRLHSIAGRPLTLFTDFDVAAYTRDARGRLTVAKAKVAGIEGDVRDDLAFLWRIDSAALSETRALLASWTGNEGRITAFVATWAYERLWLAYGVRDLLTAHGETLPEPFERARPSVRARAWYDERVLPIVVPVWTALVGESVAAGQMARLAVQEAAMQAAYRALLPRLSGEAHRVLHEVVERRDQIVRFFRMEASARITRSPQEARMARWHLQSRWRPFRVVGVADPDEGRALASIFRSPEDQGMLESADADLRRLLMERPTPFWGAPSPTPGFLARKERHGVRP